MSDKGKDKRTIIPKQPYTPISNKRKRDSPSNASSSSSSSSVRPAAQSLSSSSSSSSSVRPAGGIQLRTNNDETNLDDEQQVMQTIINNLEIDKQDNNPLLQFLKLHIEVQKKILNDIKVLTKEVKLLKSNVKDIEVEAVAEKALEHEQSTYWRVSIIFYFVIISQH